MEILISLNMTQLGTENLRRMIRTAACHTLNMETIPNPTHLMQEVRTDYIRTMNKIILQHIYKLGKEPHVFNSLNLPLSEGQRAFSSLEQRAKSNQSGVISFPKNEFADQFIGFSFQTFLTSPEALNSILRVNEECIRVINQQLFSFSDTLLTYESREAAVILCINKFRQLMTRNIQHFSQRI